MMIPIMPVKKLKVVYFMILLTFLCQRGQRAREQ